MSMISEIVADCSKKTFFKIMYVNEKFVPSAIFVSNHKAL